VNIDERPHVAYIVSIAHGLDAWTYREMDALTEGGLKVTIFPLRYNPGPYMPKQEWDCYRFNKLLVFLHQLTSLLRHPASYIRLFSEALKTHSLGYFALAIDFSRQMARRKVDMIHCVFGDHKFFVGYYCKRILRIPLSVALYGYELRRNPNLTMLLRALPLADAVIVNCDFNKKLLTDIAGEKIGARTRVIRHFAQIPAVERSARVKILVVGGFVARKGHDILFKALRELGPGAEKIEVWVAGYPGPVDVEQLARDLGVADHVRVFGAIADQGINVLFRECDIFCLPSRTVAGGANEGLPVALIEAMAYGKPVIATRLGGIPELVEEVLVEESDIKGLAQAIRWLSDNPDVRRSSGARNQEIVGKRYSRQNLVNMRDLWLERLIRRSTK
jgi:colanic acid/amylovoran biosynthesis glycosyltransferase